MFILTNIIVYLFIYLSIQMNWYLFELFIWLVLFQASCNFAGDSISLRCHLAENGEASNWAQQTEWILKKKKKKFPKLNKFSTAFISIWDLKSLWKDSAWLVLWSPATNDAKSTERSIGRSPSTWISRYDLVSSAVPFHLFISRDLSPEVWDTQSESSH